MRKSNYSVGEIFQNCFYLIRTKFFFHNARMIRYPIYVRGKKYIDFGTSLTTGRNCRFEVNGVHKSKCIIFGDNVNIGDNVRISAIEKIDIGNNVLMGSKVLIIDNSHGIYSGENQDSPMVPPNKRVLSSAPIRIGDNVWIGEGCVIQAGVTVGRGSIIAANSVVTSNVSVNSIVGGVPAKEIKRYDVTSGKWERIK